MDKTKAEIIERLEFALSAVENLTDIIIDTINYVDSSDDKRAEMDKYFKDPDMIKESRLLVNLKQQ